MSGESRSLQSLIDAAPLSVIQLRVILLCTLVAVSEGIDLNCIPLLAPAIARSWGLPGGALGFILSAGPIGLIIGGFGVGYVSDRIGRRGALIAAMLVMTLATIATAFVRDIPQLLVCRVLTGIGFGGVVPVTSTLVSEYLPTRVRPSVVAFVILGQSAGGLLAALLMSTPIASFDWQLIIAMAGGLCAFTTLLLLVALPESPRYLLLRGASRLGVVLAKLRITATPDPEALQRVSAWAQLRDLFADGRARGTCLLWATFIGVCAPVSFFTSWLPSLYGLAGKPDSAGISASAAYWAGGIAGGLILPLFCVRWHVNKVLIAAIAGAGLSAFALAVVMPLADGLNWAMAFICGIFISGAFYLLYPPAVNFYPTAIRSTGVGAAIAFGRIGNTLSPLVAGLLFSAGRGPALVTALMGLPVLLSLAAMLAFSRLERRGAIS